MSIRESLTVAVLAIVIATAVLAFSKGLWRILRRGLSLALNTARRSRPFVASRGFVRNLVARLVVVRVEARRISARPLSVESTSEYKVIFPGHVLHDERVPAGAALLTLRVRGDEQLGRLVRVEWRKGADNNVAIERAWSALEYVTPPVVVKRLEKLGDGSIGVAVDSRQPGHWSGDQIPEDPPPVRFRYRASVDYRIRVLSELDAISSDQHPQAGIRTAFRFYRSISEYGTPWTDWMPARFAPDIGDEVIVETRNRQI